MQKISVNQEFDCSLSLLLRAREERYKHLDKFPELKNVKIISEETEGNVLKQVRHISIAGSLPPVISTLMPPGADSLHEKSEFNEENLTHTFQVSPGGHENLFLLKGVSRYYELEGDRAGRNYELEITSKAFLVSMVVESTIAEIYRTNLAKDHKSILNFIKILGEEDDRAADAPAANDAAADTKQDADGTPSNGEQ